MQDRAPRAVFTLVVALLGTLVIAGCGGAGGGPSPAGGDGGESARLGVPSLGREDAPVVMTEFSDYQ